MSPPLHLTVKGHALIHRVHCQWFPDDVLLYRNFTLPFQENYQKLIELERDLLGVKNLAQQGRVRDAVYSWTH